MIQFSRWRTLAPHLLVRSQLHHRILSGSALRLKRECAPEPSAQITSDLTDLTAAIRPDEIDAPEACDRMPGARRSASLRDLIGAAAALELVFLFGFLLPLSIWRNPHVISSPQPIATVLGAGAAGALKFAVPVLAGFAVFALAVRLGMRLRGRPAVCVVLGATLIFSLTLIPTNPLASKDVFHNVFDARTLWVYGQNPGIVPPNAHRADPLYPSVTAWQAFPSTYGSAWYLIAAAPAAFAGDGLWSNVIGQKLLAAAFLLATTGLAMLIAGRLRPGAAVAAGILVGWNPLMEFETAGNGHNDIVMVCFALAAILALQRRWWLPVFSLLALAVATKYALVLLGPLFLCWLLAQRQLPRRQILFSLLLGVAGFVALGWWFFAGVSTLSHAGRQAQYITSSPGALLDAILRARFHTSPAAASAIMKLVVVPLYAAAYLCLLRRLRGRMDLEALLNAGAWATFLLLLIVTWWFWPWYVVFLVPLAALLPGSRAALVATVFSATAMLMYIPYFWLLHANPITHQAACVATAFLLPALVALAHVRGRGARFLAPAPGAP